jgi:hypothetical protein
MRGVVLDDRYRLDQVRSERPLQPRGRAVLWRGFDVGLERHVAVLVIHGLTKDRRRRITATATRASQVTDARFARILDVGEGGRAPDAIVWVATEWVDGPSLAATVRGGPLSPAAATEIARQCAEALQLAERAGLRHGRLHPEQVLLPMGGVPRITGLGLAAAVHGDEPTDDVVGLGALLFAALTGRWPLSGWTGLPVVDGRADRNTRPRMVRAGIPREVDDVAHAALTGRVSDLDGLLRLLRRLPAPAATATDPAGRDGPTAWSTWTWRLAPPLVILAIGVFGWVLGSALGRVPTSTREPRAALPAAHASAPGTGAARLVWSRPPSITSFDPQGDGQEDPDAVDLAVDRDPTTSWNTDSYKGDPHFGGLKSGVGLLLDLHRPTSVRIAELALTRAGADVEIRAGDDPPRQATDLPLVAERSAASVRTRLTFRATTARYWLVWFTALPRSGSGYSVGVAELALLG